METDAELLQRFTAASDEEAFTELVGRHAGMVYGVALRITGDAGMSEEIAQAVFTIFARKARHLGRKQLSGWLHDAAVLEARNFSRKAARYRRAVSAYQTEMTPALCDSPWERISPHLDEALTRLPERSRNMVVMRFYEKLSFREIAVASGKSEEASRKEVDRSLQHLGTILKKRGITTTGAALSVVLGSQTLCVPPASAAALATASLAAVSLNSLTLLDRIEFWARTAASEKKAVVAALVALIPSAFLLARNLRLEEQVQELSRRQIIQPAPVSVERLESRGQSAGLTAPAPKATAPLHTAAKAKEQAREQAQLELTRISLNVPDLTDAQKSRMLALFESRSGKKLAAKMQAFESGAVRRYATDPDGLTEAEKALLFAMELRKTAPLEDIQMKEILSPDQFGEYVRTEEAKQVSNAETAAADVLKAVGQSIDLDPAQKDRIFQSLARLELEGPALTEEQLARPFGEREALEEARDQLVLAELSPGQAEVYSKYRAERKAGQIEFLKSFGPREGAK